MSAIKFNLHLRDFHRAHKKRKHGIENTATLKEYVEIIKTMGDILGDELVKKGRTALPAIPGWEFKIVKTKQPYYVDRHASSKAGERVLATNDHSDGFACTIVIEPSVLQMGKKNKNQIYWFKADRSLSRDKMKNYIRYNKAVIYNYETVVNS